MRMTVMSSNHATAVAWAAVAGGALSLAAAPSATASDQILPRPGDGPTDVAIQQLQSAGYNVSINWLEGHPNVPLRVTAGPTAVWAQGLFMVCSWVAGTNCR